MNKPIDLHPEWMAQKEVKLFVFHSNALHTKSGTHEVSFTGGGRKSDAFSLARDTPYSITKGFRGLHCLQPGKYLIVLGLKPWWKIQSSLDHQNVTNCHLFQEIPLVWQNRPKPWYGKQEHKETKTHANNNKATSATNRTETAPKHGKETNKKQKHCPRYPGTLALRSKSSKGKSRKISTSSGQLAHRLPR